MLLLYDLSFGTDNLRRATGPSARPDLPETRSAATGADRIDGSTETATVVFTDLVGSTELANRLGHDAYEAMRRAHFDTLRIAASQRQGTEIKSTGDGLVFTFGMPPTPSPA